MSPFKNMISRAVVSLGIVAVGGGTVYFASSEFDSPDRPGSGIELNETYEEAVGIARDFSGTPWKVNSGVRSHYWNQRVGGTDRSAHLSGYAGDYSTRDDSDRPSSSKRYKILRGAMDANYYISALTVLEAHGLDSASVELIAKEIVQHPHYFNRIGIAKTFIHLDADPELPPEVLWVY